MAFNPIRKIIEAPVELYSANSPTNNLERDEYDYLVNDNYAPNSEQNFEPSLHEMKQTLEYDGENIKDLEDSGLQTINLLKLASPHIIDRTRFNIPLLDSLPISFVLLYLGAKQDTTKPNIYYIDNQEISINENKWYNKTQFRGHVNVISLVKHLTAISEDLDEHENNKTLFISACKKLTIIHQKAQENENRSNLDTHELSTKHVEPKHVEATPKSTYEVSDAVKLVQEKSTKNQPIDWKALTEQLNNIPLNLVMEHIGANPNENGQRGKWKVWKSGHNVQVTGQQWNDWNSQIGGFGGISLLAYHLGLEKNIDYRIDSHKFELKKLAMKELSKVFVNEFELNGFGGETLDATYFKEPFSMPHVIDFKINQVREYLNEKRGLPLWIINKQIKAGSLFAGFPSDWKEDPNLKNPEKLGNDKVWATFLAINGNAAEMRAIDRNDQYAKILAKGSDKDLGGFLIKSEKELNEKTVVSCEASVDTMSYHAFYPGRIVSSCMGVNFNLAVKSALEALDHSFKYQLAFDNDLAGNEAAVRFKEQLINEIGDEEYNEHMTNGNISYFDLGIKCLKKTIEKGGIFYFDVKNDDIGRTAATMFQEQLFKVVPRETVKDLILKGKIKYANIAPNYGLMQDINKEAEVAFNLLSSNKPFYMVLKQGDEEEKEEIKIKRESFEIAFIKIAGTQLKQFEKEGKILYQKQALAKDWNEFLLVSKRDPKFQEKLKTYEEHFNHYNEEDIPTKKSRKKP